MADRDRVIAAVKATFGDRIAEVEDRLSASTESVAVDDAPWPTIDDASDQEVPNGAVLPGIEDATTDEVGSLVAEGTIGLRKIREGREDEVTPREQVGLEAIVVLTGRPPLFIQNGDFVKVPDEWAVLKTHRDPIKSSIRRVGRVEVDGHPEYTWVGTGFLAGPDAIITNRHVAREFARLEGQTWRFQAGMSARLDFNEEHGALDPLEFKITGIVGIHERFDLAVLKVAATSGTNQLPEPLRVAETRPGAVVGRDIYVIGYPAWDSRRNDPTYMRQIFQNVFDVKRLQPGKVRTWADGDPKFVHDASTLGGNSGSPVFDLETHDVIGLHFGGKYLQGNNAVPLWTLTEDELLRHAGINFGQPAHA